MKKVQRKLQSLCDRIQVLQGQLDDIKTECEDKLDEMYDSLEEFSFAQQKRYDKLVEDIDYISDVYYALDNAISEIENYIEY